MKIYLILHKFIKTLTPAEKLIIIDPYFYTKDGLADATITLTEIITPILDQIDHITVVYNKGNSYSQEYIKQAINAKAGREIHFNNIKSSKFHDRFWINPITKTGIVIGTSLNGIGKKIALIDRISPSDVETLLENVNSLYL
ncbi:hypothetical protein [Methylocucumis oryzae]|uniref:Phospholipase D-like domain-containing protein n=1 Tax=Methylocucumis oryzae TaxID=1632867 RepID=A0A0F3IGU1_9GAMM|nr:hypothetical protein [Methylocucumis oryzae]KJV05753.1 hypothetical protein VZ94_15825 [Methylocucumis oryzae]